MIPKDLKELLSFTKKEYLSKRIGPIYTGEEDLLISVKDLEDKIKINASYEKYIYVLKAHGLNLVANKLFSIERIDDVLYVLIPDYDLLLTALDIYSKLTYFVTKKEKPDKGE
jgi:hypothetical protein